MRLIRISVVVLVLAVSLIFAPCCGKGEGEATPEPVVTSRHEVTPPATAMLEDSVAGASEVTSFRWQLEATDIRGSEEASALTTGEATVDAFHVRTVASDDPDDEQIYVGGKRYFRTGDGPWEAMDFPSQCWTCSLMSQIELVIDTIVDAEVVGEEEVNGVLTVHIKGRTDMAAKAKQIWPDYDTADPEMRQGWEGPREQFLAGTELVDLWLGQEDELLRKVRIGASFPAVADYEPYSYDVTYSLWDYNAEIVIEAPVVP